MCINWVIGAIRGLRRGVHQLLPRLPPFPYSAVSVYHWPRHPTTTRNARHIYWESARLRCEWIHRYGECELFPCTAKQTAIAPGD
jgi:hypothetical protein